jgi:hypothetical protein
MERQVSGVAICVGLQETNRGGRRVVGMMDLDFLKSKRSLFLRIVGSILLYGVFVALSVSWILTRNPTLKWALFVPLVAAVFVLPRKLPETLGEEVEGDSVEMRTLARLGRWLSMVRVVYLLVALFVLLGLPEILS